MRDISISRWLKRIALIMLLSAVAGSPASAQSVQSNLDSPPVPGTTARGELRLLESASIEQITERQSDSLWNGALIGAGVAIASGLVLCTAMETWENCRDDVGPMLRIGAIGAGIGIAIDALIRGRRPIDEGAPRSVGVHAAPIVGRHQKGFQVSLSF